ncbi:MAG: tetratricopeptide repeat protein [Thermoplasmata archaeon]|nr:tetratricopeptide repeat protein [Thermoplasmata archaeon]
MAGTETAKGSAVPPIFGRAEAVTEIDRTLDRARAGAGEGLLLSGEDGSGKSLFFRTTIQHARHRSFRVLDGRALPEEIPQPFSLVRALVRSADRSPRPERAAPETALPLFLAPFLGDDPSGGGLSADRVEPTIESDSLATSVIPFDATGSWTGTSRDELFATLTQYLTDLARDQPLLLAIDDLHFADASSIEFLGRLAPELGHRSMAVIATVATGSRIPAGVREAIESFARSTTLRTVPLRPLTTPEVGEFAQWVRRGLPPDPADVLRWHAQTEGNPLFVEQLVRSTTGVGVRPAPAAPEGTVDLNEILLGRVRQLDETELRTLTYSALLGKEFAFSNLVAISESDEERVTESLDRLVAGGLLREKGDEVCEFVTEGVRAAVYAELTETRRRILHRRVGRSLEAKGLASEFELARQFYLGRDDAKAAEYNLRAAVTAMRAFAFDTAVPHFERALEAERRRPDRSTSREIRTLVDLGRAFDELGELHRSDVVLSEAVSLARTRPELDPELGRALLGLAQTRQNQSEYPSAEALAQEAYGRLEHVGTPREVMTAHRVLGVVCWRLGRFADAERHLRLALQISENDGTPIEQGHAMVDLANMVLEQDGAQFSQALQLYEKAAELFGSGQDLSARARVLMNRAELLRSAGRQDEALAGIGLAIEAAERSRSPIWIGYCYLNLALLHAELGQPDRARPALERAATLLLPLGDRLAPEQLSLARGLLAEAEKNYSDAETHLTDALRQARELNAEPEVCEILFRLAHLAYSTGDLPGARTKLAVARAAGLEASRSDLAVRVAALDRALASDP